VADDQAASVATANELDLPRIKPRILRQEVLGALRTAILANSIPAGSRLLEAPEVSTLVQPFDPAALAYPWAHPDPRMDQLQREVQRAVRGRRPRAEVFEIVWRLAEAALDAPVQDRDRYLQSARRATRRPIPTMSEPWYC